MIKLSSVLAAFCVPVLAQAALLVCENFDYGLPEATNMDGIVANATGLKDTYSFLDTGATGAKATFSTTGLSFGADFLPVSGGAVTINVGPEVNSGAILGVPLDIGAQKGTIYRSYLFKLTSSGATAIAITDATSYVRFNATGGTQGTLTSWFQSGLKGLGSNLVAAVGYTNGSNVPAPAHPLRSEAVYWVVNKITNVGNRPTPASPGTITTGVFDRAHYEAWIASGAGEDTLFAAALSTATSSVTGGAALPLGNGTYMQYTAFSGFVSGKTITVVYDEVRVGTALADVARVSGP